MLDQLPRHWFGEGVTVHGDKCIQLLWREGLMLERDPQSFRIRRTLRLPQGIGEGWGLTSDGDATLFVSDGSSRLHALSSDTMEPIRTITVRAGGREVHRINELQWVRGEILANIYGEDFLAAIDPASGQVRYFVDLGSILSQDERGRLGVEEV